MGRHAKEKKVIGWREWVSLPDLNIGNIKAKIDTGARTSSLHAYDLEVFQKNGRDHVRFCVHPVQRNTKVTVQAEAEVHEFRKVKSSTGHQSMRPVIITTLELMGDSWPIELTLANRDEMGFRMLLGRECFRRRMLVDAGSSYLGLRFAKTVKNSHITSER